MSVVIGLPFANEPRKSTQVFIDGILVCSDTKLVTPDYATTHGTKVGVSLGQNRRAFVIANASEDMHASEMLAGDIGSALCDPEPSNLETIIKQQMQVWHSAYGGAAAPVAEFIIGCSVKGHCSLFFCSPPNTVLRKFHPFAIGTGSRAIAPFLPDETEPLWKLEPTILRAAYLMNRAKKYEGAFVGGKTDAVVINKLGRFAFLEHEEMEQAERISQEADKLFNALCLGLFSRESEEKQTAFIAGFSQLYTDAATKINATKFDSLGFLDKLNKLMQSSS